jgi:hypothetical protein
MEENAGKTKQKARRPGGKTWALVADRKLGRPPAKKEAAKKAGAKKSKKGAK